MSIRITACLVFMVAFTAITIPAQAIEPTWLFSIPKAESLAEGTYNLGLLYADFGLTENLELGIHGLKYSMPASSLAFGVSLYPIAGPYVVKGLNLGSGEVHLGLKTAPYVFFAGFEMPVSNNVKFVAELNNGVLAGVRIFPARKWTLDIFALFINVEGYKYKGYGRLELDEFHLWPGILFAYSDRF